MRRSVTDLKANALNFWPTELAHRERHSSVIPKLIESQDKFISLLHCADKSPTAWRVALDATAALPGNLFLKHLAVLTDISGERLQRFHAELGQVLGSNLLRFSWREQTYQHQMESLAGRPWTNQRLRIHGSGVHDPASLTPAMIDVAMLMLFGGSSVDPEIPEEILHKCAIGSMLGNKRALNKFVRQRYIWVSRITGGATANSMGHLAQTYVREQLQQALPTWNLAGKTIPGISHNQGRTDMAFDIVATSPEGRHCAVEVSFQVTTNSTIERKAGQAQARYKMLHDRGHYIAYVIDGAGNLERSSAISSLCQYSDCTVTFRDSELGQLARFLTSLGS